MENNILKHRLAVQQNIQKGFNSDFESFDELEKAKWNVGDTKVYQGVTYEVGGFNAKGAPLWRKAKGGAGGGASDSGSSAKTSNVSQPTKQNSSKVKEDVRNDNHSSSDVKQKSIKKNSEIDEVAEGFNSFYRMEEEMKNLKKKLNSNSISFFKNLGFNQLAHETVNDRDNRFLKKIKPNDLDDCEVEIKPEFDIDVWNKLSSKLIISVKNKSGNIVFNAGINGGSDLSNPDGLKKIMSLSKELVSGKDFFKTLLSVKNDFYHGNIENEFNRLSAFVIKKKSENKNSTIKKNVWNMTNSELIKEFKIPRTILNHHTIKGYKTWDDGEYSSHSQNFLDHFRKAVEKYGNPIEIKKKNFSSKDQRSYDHSRRNGIEYDWIDGEKIEIKFKTKDGKDIILDNL